MSCYKKLDWETLNEAGIYHPLFSFFTFDCAKCN